MKGDRMVIMGFLIAVSFTGKINASAPKAKAKTKTAKPTTRAGLINVIGQYKGGPQFQKSAYTLVDLAYNTPGSSAFLDMAEHLLNCSENERAKFAVLISLSRKCEKPKPQTLPEDELKSARSQASTASEAEEDTTASPTRKAALEATKLAFGCTLEAAINGQQPPSRLTTTAKAS